MNAFLLILLVSALMTTSETADSQNPSHGISQIEAVTQDRPRLGKSLEGRESIQKWIIERFNNTIPLIVWDSAPPFSGRKAEFDATNPDTTRVRVNTKDSGIDQLAALLFELHNIGHYQEFEAIHDRALRGEVSREEYAELMLGSEFEALLELRVFLTNHLDDLSETERKEARAYYRLRYGSKTLEKHVAHYLKTGFDLRKYYWDLYDAEVMPERVVDLEPDSKP